MTVRSFPFSGQDAAEDDYYRLHRECGVISGLALTLAGLTWSLAVGEVYVGGSQMLVETAPETGASVATSGANPRRDMLVARRTLLPDGGSSTVVALLQGNTASSPVDPTPDREIVGVFEEPLWSWQVPGGGGTALTDIRDLRGQRRADGGRNFATAYARDLHLPAPAAGDRCAVAGIDQVHNGSRWVFSKADTFTQSTDGSGVITIIHGLGVIPVSFQLTRSNFAAANIADGRVNALSSTQAQIVVTRTDDGAALANNPVGFYWEATS